MKKFLAVIALTILSAPARAGIKTVTLSVPTMHCAVCPITVKKALNKVPGVKLTAVSFDKHEATVTFDDSKTSVDILMNATRDAGYPSTLETSAK